MTMTLLQSMVEASGRPSESLLSNNKTTHRHAFVDRNLLAATQTVDQIVGCLGHRSELTLIEFQAITQLVGDFGLRSVERATGLTLPEPDYLTLDIYLRTLHEQGQRNPLNTHRSQP